MANNTAYPAPDEAYLVGLLHDLGRLFISHPTALPEARVLTQVPSDIPALEQRLFAIMRNCLHLLTLKWGESIAMKELHLLSK